MKTTFFIIKSWCWNSGYNQWFFMTKILFWAMLLRRKKMERKSIDTRKNSRAKRKFFFWTKFHFVTIPVRVKHNFLKKPYRLGYFCMKKKRLYYFAFEILRKIATKHDCIVLRNNAVSKAWCKILVISLHHKTISILSLFQKIRSNGYF